MQTTHPPTSIDTATLLSSLWVFVLLNIIFRDLHEFTTADTINEILSGTVNGTRITDRLLLIGAVLVEVPILMVVVSRVLGRRANRAANVAAAVVTTGVILSALPGDPDDRVFSAIELAALGYIIWLVWRWRSP